MDPKDNPVSYQGEQRQQGADPHSQKSQSTGTSGGGSGKAAPQPTAEAPVPHGQSGAGDTPSAAGARGISSGLEPGGTKPGNTPLAGEGRVGTPGASSEPGTSTAPHEQQRTREQI
jgi:hypothetical protein